MIEESSYGIVPFKKERSHWVVLLIQHSKGKFWGFPKGHAEKEETAQEAAVRELFEETHLTVVRFFSETLICQEYNYTSKGSSIHKTVYFFSAEVKGKLSLQKEEISRAIWLSPLEAKEKLTYQSDKMILQEALLSARIL